MYCLLPKKHHYDEPHVTQLTLTYTLQASSCIAGDLATQPEFGYTQDVALFYVPWAFPDSNYISSIAKHVFPYANMAETSTVVKYCTPATSTISI